MPIFKNDMINRNLLRDVETLSLGWYFPAGNLPRDPWSQAIIGVKQHEPEAVAYVSGILKKIISEDNQAIILTIPSSTADSISGMNEVVSQMYASDPEHDSSNWLRRTRSIPKAAQGGTRDEALHVQTMELLHPEQFRGRTVIILDDVKTSGASFKAACRVVKAAGAKQVVCLSLGRTYSIDKAKEFNFESPSQKELSRMLCLSNLQLRANGQQFLQQQKLYTKPKASQVVPDDQPLLSFGVFSSSLDKENLTPTPPTKTQPLKRSSPAEVKKTVTPSKPLVTMFKITKPNTLDGFLIKKQRTGEQPSASDSTATENQGPKS